MNSIKTFLIVLMMNVCCAGYTFSATLLDFNEPGASDSTWPGWTWMPDGASDFGDPGWRKDSGVWVSSGSNWMPRTHNKGSDNVHGSNDLAIIDSTEMAPSTTSGASLKVYDFNINDSVHRAGWWFLYGKNFGAQGLADASTDRLSFYMKPEGFTSDPKTETSSIVNYNMHFGTYLCWDGGGLGGENCPKEASNQHYYHHLTVHDGAWLHVLLDRHPQHLRGSHTHPLVNPKSPHNYYENMHAFYLEFTNSQSALTAYWVDEMELYTTTQSENDNSISSVWVGYWPGTDKWEIGFSDGSFGSEYNDFSNSVFEIRYSTSPITNENFSLATPINPEYHGVGEVGVIRRPQPWKFVAWTRFMIPDNIESNNEKIYFAIKDVSINGGHIGSWPYIQGDGHNAPSSNIHTIDYYMANVGSTNTSPPPPPSTDTSPPSPPQHLTITLGQ